MTEEGGCADEIDAIYLATDGVDSGVCTRSVPCFELNYALTHASGTRIHIVFAPGEYEAMTSATTADTSALSVYIHGHGASVTAQGGNSITLTTDIPVIIDSLTLRNPSNTTLVADGLTKLRRVSIVGQIFVRGVVDAEDLDVEATDSTGISVYGSLILNRARIRGGTNGVYVSSGSVEITNSLISGTTETGIDMMFGTGVLKFTTVVQTGFGGTAGQPFGVQCGSGLTIEDSIIWSTYQTIALPIAGACTSNGRIRNSIAGPTAVGDAANTDPEFVSELGGNYRLAAGSPARDAAFAGPSTDVERNPRPQGAGFDIGAYESP